MTPQVPREFREEDKYSINKRARPQVARVSRGRARLRARFLSRLGVIDVHFQQRRVADGLGGFHLCLPGKV